MKLRCWILLMVISFALSDAASWVNGIDIPVEGGLFAARAATPGGTT